MRLRERWEGLPVRLRAGLTALLLVLTLLLLWWLSGWAWPTRALAHRALEREHLFGHGEIVAEGEITHAEDASPFGQSGTHFVVSERDGRYAVSVLRPKWGFGHGEIVAEGEITHAEDASPFGQSGTHFVVSERDGRYAVSVLRPKWGFLWRSTEDLFWSYQVLIPTEEKPLTYVFLVSDPIYTVSSGLVHTSGWDYLLLVASADPDIVRVEVTIDLVSRDELEQDPDWGLHHGVTVTATETEPGSGLWLAHAVPDDSNGSTYVALRGYDAALTYVFLVSDPIYTVSSGLVHTSGWDYLLLVASADPDIVRVEVTIDLVSRDELEQDPDWGLHHGVTVTATETEPGSGLWLAHAVPDDSNGSTYVALRGYDAAGELVYTYIPQ